MAWQVDDHRVYFAEAIGAMVLSFTVLMAACTEAQKGNGYFGIAIA